MQDWVIIVAVIIAAIVLVVGLLWHHNKGASTRWIAPDVFLKKSGLSQLGAVLAREGHDEYTLALLVIAGGAAGKPRLITQRYNMHVDDDQAKITIESSVADDGTTPGALLDNRSYNYVLDSDELKLYDDSTIYLHLVSDI